MCSVMAPGETDWFTWPDAGDVPLGVGAPLVVGGGLVGGGEVAGLDTGGLVGGGVGVDELAVGDVGDGDGLGEADALALAPVLQLGDAFRDALLA
jgi:hypothetical protein